MSVDAGSYPHVIVMLSDARAPFGLALWRSGE